MLWLSNPTRESLDLPLVFGGASVHTVTRVKRNDFSGTANNAIYTVMQRGNPGG